MKRIHISLLIVVIALSAGTAGWVVQTRADDDLFELKKNFEIFGALYEEIILNYVDQVRPAPFMRAGVDAMLTRLDPYTQFYDQADNVDLDAMRQRAVGDVGLNIGMRDERMTVLAPEANAEAYQRGIRVGDVILKIDGVDVAGWTVRDAAGLLRGDEGTSVDVDVERLGEARTLSFKLIRRVVRTENVSYSGDIGASDEAIGYVRLTMFGDRAAREVRRALRDLARDRDLDAIVLDLRDNPGGILGEAIQSVGLFVPKGSTVVSTQGRIEDVGQAYTTQEEPFFEDVPVIVLTNGISASASEIVAGAFQDMDRGIVVGQTTFGKGLVQIIRPLPYNTSMKITIGHYYTPSGRDIQSRRIASLAAEVSAPEVQVFRTVGGRAVRSGVGIEPDIVVSDSRPSEFVEALHRRGAFFEFAGVYEAANLGVSVDDLTLDSATLLQLFREWLDLIRFDYVSRADVLLDSLAVRFTEAQYGGAMRSLDELRRAASDEQENDIDRHGEEIATRIRRDILSRYLSEPERIRRSLTTDPVVLRALELVRTPEAYDRLLGRQRQR